jgi:hypothetical protein
MHSTQTGGGSNKGITEDFLKDTMKAAAEVADDRKSSSPASEQKASGSDSGGDDSSQDKGSDKKNGRWTGKNAWKLGMVVLGGWSAITGSVLVYIWGEPVLLEVDYIMFVIGQL